MAGTTCTADTTLTSCGPSGTDCMVGLTANATAVCNAAKNPPCGFTCNSGYKLSKDGKTCKK
jgi:hypothetical protein